MTAPAPGRDTTAVRGAVVLVVFILIGIALLYASGNDDDAEATARTSTTEATTATASAAVTGSQSTLVSINNSSSVPDTTTLPESTTVLESTTVPESTTDPDDPDDTRVPADVTTVVLNGTTDDVAGVAGDNNEKLTTAGYSTLEAGNANDDLATTTIYCSPEMQADCEAIRGVLGFSGAVVEVKPDESVGDRSEEADVVVVIGDDVAAD